MAQANSYLVSVRSDSPIPHDVLVEHIAVALRDFRYAGKVDVKMAHPFDDPSNVKFDDDVQLEEYSGPQPQVPKFAEGGHVRSDSSVGHVVGGGCCELPADPYPLTTRVVDFLRGIARG